jgi:hypothetical protein
MRLWTDYDLRVPNDSVATVEDSGVLGTPRLEIDISHASGPPLANWGTLPSREPEKFDAHRIMEVLGAWATQAAKDDVKPQKPAPMPPKSH